MKNLIIFGNHLVEISGNSGRFPEPDDKIFCQNQAAIMLIIDPSQSTHKSLLISSHIAPCVLKTAMLSINPVFTSPQCANDPGN